MKKIVMVGIIILIFVPGVFAQIRLDLAIDVPWKIGISSDTDSDFVNDSVDVIDTIGTLPFPEASLVYQYTFDTIPLHVGGGLRVFSWILISGGWPIVYAEMDLDPVVIHANIGGLGFFYFGLLSGSTTSSILIPDLHIAYKFGETFRLGIGAMAFTGIDEFEGSNPYTLYLTGRFSILFDKDKL